MRVWRRVGPRTSVRPRGEGLRQAARPPGSARKCASTRPWQPDGRPWMVRPSWTSRGSGRWGPRRALLHCRQRRTLRRRRRPQRCAAWAPRCHRRPASLWAWCPPSVLTLAATSRPEPAVLPRRCQKQMAGVWQTCGKPSSDPGSLRRTWLTSSGFGPRLSSTARPWARRGVRRVRPCAGAWRRCALRKAERKPRTEKSHVRSHGSKKT
mmetsp:Transcript_101129/g.316081  ORF Transcript_101129/g.316081 Transcript_101129/m.316081 type:complete len:209 (+) Transcript_101129:244-870(+)